MAKDWSLTQESFETLLAWLDSERETAGQKYERIRCRLIKVFQARGCSDAEDLADETINRAACKIIELTEPYSGDPALYIYGIAQKICLESTRKKTNTGAIPDPGYTPVFDQPSDEYFLERHCLNRCLAELSDDDRQIVLQYYASEERTNIDHRQQLAQKFALTLNTLRVRAFRIRQRLQKCAEDCLAKQKRR